MPHVLNFDVPQLRSNRPDKSRSRLVGALPSMLRTTSELKVLRMHSNRLVSTIPAGWSTMSELVQLALGDNDLSGPNNH